MAAITLDKVLNRIYWSVSGVLPAGPAQDPVRTQLTAALQSQLPDFWDQAAAEVLIYKPGAARDMLQFLCCKRIAIEVMLGQLSASVDAMLGRVFRISASQKFRNLYQLLDATNKLIALWEPRAAASGASPLVGAILQTAPVMTGPVGNVPQPDSSEPTAPPDEGVPGIDPNATVYEGDPRFRTWPEGGW